jgi:hypothetical protein
MDEFSKWVLTWMDGCMDSPNGFSLHKLKKEKKKKTKKEKEEIQKRKFHSPKTHVQEKRKNPNL